jgi:hypothetical protein
MSVQTHKLLVNKFTGKVDNYVAYKMDENIPYNPKEQVFISIDSANPYYKNLVSDPPEDLGDIALFDSYWDFDAGSWVFPEPPQHNITLEFLKQVRDNMLKTTDDIMIDIDISDEDKVGWATYRQQLRDYFVDFDVTQDLTQIVWPKNPDDSKALANGGGQ